MMHAANITPPVAQALDVLEVRMELISTNPFSLSTRSGRMRAAYPGWGEARSWDALWS
jgi:hypothetical protein